MTLRYYEESDVPRMTEIWNEIIEEGVSFPGDEPLSPEEASAMFAGQTSTVVAEEGGHVVGLYVLHPNNFGRAGHIANASFAVHSSMRGKGTGRQLVAHCLEECGRKGFTGLQFNAVVDANKGAIKLYLDMGFTQVGTIPKGFRYVDGTYQDIHIFYHDTPKP